MPLWSPAVSYLHRVATPSSPPSAPEYPLPPPHNLEPSHPSLICVGRPHPSPPPPSPTAPCLASSPTVHLPMTAVAAAAPSPVFRPHRHTVAPMTAVIKVSVACITFTTPPPPSSRVSLPLSNVATAQGSRSPSHCHADDDIVHGSLSYDPIAMQHHAPPLPVCTLPLTPRLHPDPPLPQYGRRRCIGRPSAV
jgi:hypothetical protein